MNYGEIISLGRHRLMCGDARKCEDVEKLIAGEKVDLVLTDPPYGMKCQDKNGAIGDSKRITMISPEFKKENGFSGGHGSKKTYKCQAKQYPLMANDNDQNCTREHYEIIKDVTDKIIMWGGQYFAHFLPVSGGWIFWDKKTGKSDFSDGELAWRSWGKKVTYYEQKWRGFILDGSARLNGLGGNNKRDTRSRIHPTQKPVELHMNILEDFSQEGEVVLDCFGGSGTTLIACELTGRKCLMMELSPEYCEIIRERYEKVKALTPLFNEEN